MYNHMYNEREVERGRKTKESARNRCLPSSSECSRSQMSVCSNITKHEINVLQVDKTHNEDRICNLRNLAPEGCMEQIYYGYVIKLVILRLVILLFSLSVGIISIKGLVGIPQAEGV